jgi:hypothetical protein
MKKLYIVHIEMPVCVLAENETGAHLLARESFYEEISNGAVPSLTIATRGTQQSVPEDWLDSEPYGVDAGYKGTCREIL